MEGGREKEGKSGDRRRRQTDRQANRQRQARPLQESGQQGGAPLGHARLDVDIKDNTTLTMLTTVLVKMSSLSQADSWRAMTSNG